MGRRFLVRTDQQSLKFLLHQKEINPEYQKWVRKLLGFNFKVRFKPGATNRVADALSRKNKEDMELGTLLTTNQVEWEELEKEIAASSDLQLIRMKLELQSDDYAGFTIQGNKLLYKGRLVIPKNSVIIPVLLRQYHDFVVGGHAGELKTYLRLAAEWFWVGMRRDVKNHVQQCNICQQNRLPNNYLRACYNPYPYQRMCGTISQWILLKGYLCQKGWIPFWLW